MKVCRNLENAMAAWIRSHAEESAGGLFLIRTQQGAGASLQIRTSHSDEGELPETGVVICECFDSAAQVLEPACGLNAYALQLSVVLKYPAFAHTEDPMNVASFDSLVDELGHLIFFRSLTTELTRTGEGVEVLGETEAFSVRTNIDGKMRVCQWLLGLAVSETDKLEVTV